MASRATSDLGRRGVSPSNRRETALLKCKGPSAAVDTLGLSLPIEPDFDTVGCTITIDKAGTDDEGYRYRRTLPGGGFLATGVGGAAWLEASLPKRADADGSNVYALDLPSALETAREMVREAEAFVTPDRRRDGHCFELAKVVRLDLVRDFDGISKMPDLLDGLSGVRQAGRAKVRRFADGERNMAQTLRVGPGAWASTLYDKRAETNGRAPEGRLRFEARLHAEQLTSVGAAKNGGHVGCVADLEEQKLRRLRRWMFERVGFDREVAGMGQAIEKVFGDNGLSKRQQREVWAYLTARPYGVDLGYHRNTAARLEAIVRRLGIVVAGEILEPAAVTVRLDYDEGRQVLHAA